MTAHALPVAAVASDSDRNPETYPAMFQATARRVPDRAALRTPGDQVHLTWAEYACAVERAAGALAGLGVEHGDRVALLSRNRPELAIADVAVMHLGASTVALYVASPASTIEPPSGWFPPDEDAVPLMEQAAAGAVSMLIQTFALPRAELQAMVAKVREGVTASDDGARPE